MIIGIDLGTTYSAVAALDPSGRPHVLRNRIGETTTASCVSFVSRDEVVVGSLAKERLALDPENTVALIKRHMGAAYPLTFHGVDHTPESISAILLRALVADAAAELTGGRPEPVQAVITVPAYFGLREREATQQAADMAGINVLELVAEPVAAALHYGGSDAANRTVLVYDLGGGTFDCTVLRCTGGAVAVLVTDGDSHLGGAEVDGRLGHILLERLAEMLGPDVEHPADDVAAVQMATSLAETAKLKLHGRTSQPVTFHHKGRVLRTEIDKTLLTQVSQDLVDRTMAIVERLVATVGPAVRFDDIVLVGGSSRLPPVSTALADRFGIHPTMVDPELAVALGAAVRAGRLASAATSGLAHDAHAVSVLPRGVGVLVRDSNDHTGLREFVQHVLAANTPLPAHVTSPFATILNNQRTVRIQVFEQAGAVLSEDVAHNRKVLDGEFTGLRECPAGSRIDVTVSVGLDGRLTVAAHEAKRGRALTLEAYVEGVVDRAEFERLTARTDAMTIVQ